MYFKYVVSVHGTYNVIYILYTQITDYNFVLLSALYLNPVPRFPTNPLPHPVTAPSAR